jgi:hypothetical protein
MANLIILIASGSSIMEESLPKMGNLMAPNPKAETFQSKLPNFRYFKYYTLKYGKSTRSSLIEVTDYAV